MKPVSKKNTQPKRKRAKAQPAPASQPSTALTDMRKFFRTTNWADVWEDWFLAVDTSGRRKYNSIRSLAKAHCKSPRQRAFMEYYCGPSKDSDPDAKRRYAYIAEPQDWVEKRRAGAWYAAETIDEHKKSIQARMNALDALRESGNKVTLNSLVRAEKLAQKLDEEFGGTFFAPGLTLEQNADRAKQYLQLHSQILALQSKAQTMYALAHGINFNDMGGFANLLTGAAMAQQLSEQGANKKKSKTDVVLEEVIKMTLNKAAKFNLPLPEDQSALIVETSAIKDEEDTAKKKIH